MDEMRHLIKPHVYKEIISEYKQKRKSLIKEVLDMGDKKDHTPLHVAAYFGNYALVRHYLRLGANTNLKDFQQRTPLGISKDKFCRKVLSNLNEAAYNCDN